MGRKRIRKEMKQVIIEEGIYDVETRLPLRKVDFQYDGKQITRRLFILGDTEKRNAKVDVIDFFRVTLEEINQLSALELGEKLKREVVECFDRNVNNEIPFFDSPIITRCQ